METNQAKSRRKMNRRLHTEYMPNNIIDEEFQAMLFPLVLVPSFFLMSQFSIINNFITPDNHVTYYIKSFMGTLILVLGHFYRFFYYSEAVKSFSSSVVIFLLYFDVIFYSLVSIMTYIVSSLHRTNVVELLIRLQHVLDCIKIDKADFLLKHKIQNWLSVIMTISVYIFQVLSNMQQVRFLDCLVNCSLAIPMLIFDIHVVNVTRLIVLIKNEIVAWTKNIDEYKNKYITSKDNAFVTISECDMFDAYINIIKAFRLCNEVYKFSFTYYGFQTFIHILITLELLIELDKSSPAESFFQTTLVKLLSAAWIMKSFILMAALSFAAENFYRSVKIAESSCAQILSYGQAAGTGMRVTCKNVLRLNRASLRKLSAYGVFELDAAFPLRLLSGLVAYTVVLLQIAFLSS